MIRTKYYSFLICFVVLGLYLLCPLMRANAAEGSHTVSFIDPMWNGETIPKKQQCRSRGAGVNPHSPKLRISNLPSGSKYILMIVTDEDYGRPGDHGKFRLDVPPGATELIFPRIYEIKKEMPPGVKIVEGNTWGAGKWGHYMPPCSGGKGNIYNSSITVFGDGDKSLGTTMIQWGEY